MATSRRHHYIPQFYLRGFTNENNEYFIFDKEKEEIRRSKPINSFYENNRNSSYVHNEKIVILENLYAHYDSKAAEQLEKIRTASIDNFVLEPEILYRIKAFIAQIYWRIPENDLELDRLIDQLSFKDAGFDFKDKNGKSIATKELQEELKNIDVFRQMYRIIVPLISSQKKYQTTDYDNWKVYFHKDKIHLTGDNPLIISEFKDFSSLNKELLFPISANRLFIHTKLHKPPVLPPNFLVELDMLIMHQATRFVCSPSEEYLKFLVEKLYPYCKGHNFTNQMKDNIFGYFAQETNDL